MMKMLKISMKKFITVVFVKKKRKKEIMMVSQSQTLYKMILYSPIRDLMIHNMIFYVFNKIIFKTNYK